MEDEKIDSVIDAGGVFAIEDKCGTCNIQEILFTWISGYSLSSIVNGQTQQVGANNPIILVRRAAGIDFDFIPRLEVRSPVVSRG
jgi:hypothetical protein